MSLVLWSVRSAPAQPWQGTDVDSPPIAGTDSIADNVYTITGSGEGIGGISKPSVGYPDLGISGYQDQFHFLYTTIPDNTQIVARLTSVSGGGSYNWIRSKEAGLTIRSDLTASPTNGSQEYRGGKTYSTSRAPNPGPPEATFGTEYLAEYSVTLPIWLKLFRSSGGVMSYTSTDGVNWTERSWKTVPFPDTAYAGLEVASASYSEATTAVFDNVSVTTTDPLPPPPAPTDLTVTASGLNYASLTWTNPSAHFERIEVQRSTDGTHFTTITQGLPASENKYTDTGLGLRTTYIFRVAVVRGTQTSYSNTVTVTTPDLTLQVDSVWATRINLRWSTTAAPTDQFIVEASTDGTNFTTAFSYVPTATSGAFDFLAPSTTYYFRISGHMSGTAIVPEQLSNVVSATTTTTPPPGSPTPPSNLRLTFFEGTAALYFAWDDNSDNETVFYLQVSRDGVNFNNAYNGTSGKVGANVATEIAPGTDYDKPSYWRVIAYNANGASLPSSTFSVTIPWVPPPSSLQAVATSANRVDLTWTDASSNETGFEVQRRASTESDYTRLGVVPANTTRYSDTTAAGGTLYFYRVRSLSGIGASAAFATAFITTPATGPGPGGSGSTPQTITFASPTGAVRVGQPITLGATSSAGLPITYSVVSGDATISGNVLTPQSTSDLVVRASSPGDATYAAASTDVNFGNPIPVGNSRLVNISSRVRVSAGDAAGATIAGFYVTGTMPKQILIRAVGPSLTQFGITNPVSAPQLKLVDNKNSVVATNAGWANDASIVAAGQSVGAFTLNANSTDAALLVTLAPGQYTAQVQSGNTGTALIEVYDIGSADPNPTKQLINISTRGHVGTDQDVMVAGFVVSGDAPKRILIRGVGPGISQFGVSNVVADPLLKVYDNQHAVVAQNDNWETAQPINATDTPATATQITSVDTSVGAFPLTAGSTDAAVLVTLNPGQYTAIVSGANSGTGNAIVEVYEVP